MIKPKKKFYEDMPPTSEVGEEVTLIDEFNSRKVYEAPETQEELFSLLYGEKKIEGFKDYFELLDANVLGQNETPLDIPPPKQYPVQNIKMLDDQEPKKSDEL